MPEKLLVMLSCWLYANPDSCDSHVCWLLRLVTLTGYAQVMLKVWLSTDFLQVSVLCEHNRGNQVT